MMGMFFILMGRFNTHDEERLLIIMGKGILINWEEFNNTTLR